MERLNYFIAFDDYVDTEFEEVKKYNPKEFDALVFTKKAVRQFVDGSGGIHARCNDTGHSRWRTHAVLAFCHSRFEATPGALRPGNAACRNGLSFPQIDGKLLPLAYKRFKV